MHDGNRWFTECWQGSFAKGGEIQNRFRGRVKWFNATKGFGFVVTEEPGPDILIHINVLRNFGRSSVSEGSTVELVANESRRGLQATEIIEIIPPPAFEISDEDESAHGAEHVHVLGDFVPARVKWFDKQRGFGFVNVFGDAEDVFIHMEVLRSNGLSDLQAGEAIAVQVSTGPRGKLVSEIQPWSSDSGADAYDD